LGEAAGRRSGWFRQRGPDAIPLLAVKITRDPRAVSLITVVGESPWILFSLFAGVLIDSRRGKNLLSFAYALQLLVAAVLCLAATSGALRLPLLMLAAFLITTSQVLGDGVSGSMVPRLVPASRLTAANTRLQVIDRGVVQFVVPPAAGALIGVGTGLPGLAACVAASTALACSRRLPESDIAPGPKTRPVADIVEGIRYLVATPLLRTISVIVAVGSFASGAGTAVFVLYATNVLHLGATGYGGLLTCLAVGWVSMSFFVQRVVNRLGYSSSMRIAQSVTAAAQVGVAALPAWPPVIGLVLMLLTASTLVWNVCSQSARQRFTPPPLLGRVLTSHRALSWGVAPLGALAGGFVASVWGLRPVYLLAGTLQAVGAMLAWISIKPEAFVENEALRAP